MGQLKQPGHDQAGFLHLRKIDGFDTAFTVSERAQPFEMGLRELFGAVKKNVGLYKAWMLPGFFLFRHCVVSCQ
jgi:hypothetical protein